MANKKKAIAIDGKYIKSRLAEVGKTQVDLAKYLDYSPRHLNRCIQSNEMAKDVANKIYEFFNERNKKDDQ